MMKKPIAIFFLSVLCMGAEATEAAGSPSLSNPTVIVGGKKHPWITVYSSNGSIARVKDRHYLADMFSASYNEDETVTIWTYSRIYDQRLEGKIRHLASQLPDIQPVRQGMSLAGIKKTYPNMWSFSLVQGVTMTTPPQTINLPAYYITYRQADIKRIVFGDLGFNHFFKPVKYGKLDYGKNYFTVKNPTQDTDREYTKGSYDADGLTDKSIVYLWKDGVPYYYLKASAKVLGIVFGIDAIVGSVIGTILWATS